MSVAYVEECYLPTAYNMLTYSCYAFAARVSYRPVLAVAVMIWPQRRHLDRHFSNVSSQRSELA